VDLEMQADHTANEDDHDELPPLREDDEIADWQKGSDSEPDEEVAGNDNKVSHNTKDADPDSIYNHPLFRSTWINWPKRKINYAIGYLLNSSEEASNHEINEMYQRFNRKSRHFNSKNPRRSPVAGRKKARKREREEREKLANDAKSGDVKHADLNNVSEEKLKTELAREYPLDNNGNVDVEIDEAIDDFKAHQNLEDAKEAAALGNLLDILESAEPEQKGEPAKSKAPLGEPIAESKVSDSLLSDLPQTTVCPFTGKEIPYLQLERPSAKLSDPAPGPTTIENGSVKRHGQQPTVKSPAAMTKSPEHPSADVLSSIYQPSQPTFHVAPSSSKPYKPTDSPSFSPASPSNIHSPMFAPQSPVNAQYSIEDVPDNLDLQPTSVPNLNDSIDVIHFSDCIPTPTPPPPKQQPDIIKPCFQDPRASTGFTYVDYESKQEIIVCKAFQSLSCKDPNCVAQHRVVKCRHGATCRYRNSCYYAHPYCYENVVRGKCTFQERFQRPCKYIHSRDKREITPYIIKISENYNMIKHTNEYTRWLKAGVLRAVLGEGQTRVKSLEDRVRECAGAGGDEKQYPASSLKHALTNLVKPLEQFRPKPRYQQQARVNKDVVIAAGQSEHLMQVFNKMVKKTKVKSKDSVVEQGSHSDGITNPCAALSQSAVQQRVLQQAPQSVVHSQPMMPSTSLPAPRTPTLAVQQKAAQQAPIVSNVLAKSPPSSLPTSVLEQMNGPNGPVGAANSCASSVVGASDDDSDDDTSSENSLENERRCQDECEQHQKAKKQRELLKACGQEVPPCDDGKADEIVHADTNTPAAAALSEIQQYINTFSDLAELFSIYKDHNTALASLLKRENIDPNKIAFSFGADTEYIVDVPLQFMFRDYAPEMTDHGVYYRSQDFPQIGFYGAKFGTFECIQHFYLFGKVENDEGKMVRKMRKKFALYRRLPEGDVQLDSNGRIKQSGSRIFNAIGLPLLMLEDVATKFADYIIARFISDVQRLRNYLFLTERVAKGPRWGHFPTHWQTVLMHETVMSDVLKRGEQLSRDMAKMAKQSYSVTRSMYVTSLRFLLGLFYETHSIDYKIQAMESLFNEFVARFDMEHGFGAKLFCAARAFASAAVFQAIDYGALLPGLISSITTIAAQLEQRLVAKPKFAVVIGHTMSELNSFHYDDVSKEFQAKKDAKCVNTELPEHNVAVKPIMKLIPSFSVPYQRQTQSSQAIELAIRKRQIPANKKQYCMKNHEKNLKAARLFAEQMQLTVTDDEVMTVEEYVHSRKHWKMSKKLGVLTDYYVRNHMPEGYRANTFLKEEFLNKHPLKPGRVINGCETYWKHAIGPQIMAISNRLKKQWRYGSHNAQRLIYGSGLCRESAGQQFSMIMREFQQRNLKPHYTMIDLETFDGTQTKEALECLDTIYDGITMGEINTKLKIYNERVRGEKHMKYAHKDQSSRWKRKVTVKATVKATRFSGDMDTSLGNSLLQGFIVHGLIKDMECAWAFVHGDDVLIISNQYLDAKTVESRYAGMGMVAKVETQDHHSKVEFCSSFFVRVEGGYHLTAKPGVLLSKTSLTTTKLGTLKGYALRSLKEKSMSMELQILPQISKRLALNSWWSRVKSLFVKIPNTLHDGKVDNNELRTRTTLTTNEDTARDLCKRYGISTFDLALFDLRVSADLSQKQMHLELSPSFDDYRHVAQSIIAVDLKTYTAEEIDNFQHYMYKAEYLDIYRRHYMAVPEDLP